VRGARRPCRAAAACKQVWQQAQGCGRAPQELALGRHAVEQRDGHRHAQALVQVAARARRPRAPQCASAAGRRHLQHRWTAGACAKLADPAHLPRKRSPHALHVHTGGPPPPRSSRAQLQHQAIGGEEASLRGAAKSSACRPFARQGACLRTRAGLQVGSSAHEALTGACANPLSLTAGCLGF